MKEGFGHPDVFRIAPCLDVEKVRSIFPTLDEKVARLEEIQGYTYTSPNVARTAIIHRSALVHWPTDRAGVFSNERLEFLGDSFLNHFAAFEAMNSQPHWQEGDLSRLRAAIVGAENLAAKSRALGIGECLILGRGEAMQPEDMQKNIYADAFEAVTASLLLDGGSERAWQWLARVFASDFVLGGEILKNFDAKSRFQQWVQGIVGAPPNYRHVGTESTHEVTRFIVAVFVGDIELARASALNKRQASKSAAAQLLAQVESGELTADFIRQAFLRKH